MFVVLIFISTVASFVPSYFNPTGVSREDAGTLIPLFCPFNYVGNPLPYCTWRRFDSNNVTHQLRESQITLPDPDDSSYCAIYVHFTENDNGLYQCTGHNIVGNTTYTFPERFVVESE